MSFFAVLERTRKTVLKGAALCAAFALVGCVETSLGTGTDTTIDASAPVPVALLVPKSSASSGDSLISRDLENAARLAISDLNGVKIDLRIYDTAGNAQQAANMATKAVNDGAKIILGPLRGGSANAAGIAVAGTGVKILSFSNNPEIADGNVFILGSSFGNAAGRLADYAARQGKNRIHILHAQDLGGELGRKAIASAVTGRGGQVVGSTSYPLTPAGVTTAASQAKAAVDSNQADAVFMAANAAGALPLFAQLLPENGLNPQATQYIGLTRWDTPVQTRDLKGLQGGWFAMPDPAVEQAFRSRFKEAYGSGPHPLAGLAYDGIAAIGASVKTSGRNGLTTSALTQGAGFQGVSGAFRLRSDGTTQRAMAVATLRDRQVVVIDPAPRRFGGAGF